MQNAIAFNLFYIAFRAREGIYRIDAATVYTPTCDARSRNWCPEPLFLPWLSRPISTTS